MNYSDEKEIPTGSLYFKTMDGDYDYDEEVGVDHYYYGDTEYEDDSSFSDSLHQLYILCLKPTVYETGKSVIYVFLWCFLYRITMLFIKKQSSLQHIMSVVAGLLSLHSLFSVNVYHILIFVFLTYFLLYCAAYLQYKNQCGTLLLSSSVLYLCLCELWLVDSRKWHQIRGSQMIVAMKSISLAFDFGIGKIKNLPNLMYYSGYLLNPGSCVFGPWISYNDYLFNFKWCWSFKLIQIMVLKFFFAFSFLTVSTCWSEYFLSFSNWKWLSAYREALSFRMSHYFVSFLSEATLLLSGYSSTAFDGVTKPCLVEFPRSIVNVVVYWNKPMHYWLKFYIFNMSRKFGVLTAIMSTYIASSLLHGISFQLSAVLLSLGLYSYAEDMLRKKLAGAFSACVLAKKCKKECSHTYKKYHPLVVLSNGFLLLVTMFHLAYLGVVFDSSEVGESGYNWHHCLKKWSSLDYTSHIVAFLTYLVYILIK